MYKIKKIKGKYFVVIEVYFLRELKDYLEFFKYVYLFFWNFYFYIVYYKLVLFGLFFYYRNGYCR